MATADSMGTPTRVDLPAPEPISDDLHAALLRDNAREDAGMHPDERRTCWTHQSWAEDCADHPMHADPHGYVLRGLAAR